MIARLESPFKTRTPPSLSTASQLEARETWNDRVHKLESRSTADPTGQYEYSRMKILLRSKSRRWTNDR